MVIDPACVVMVTRNKKRKLRGNWPIKRSTIFSRWGTQLEGPFSLQTKVVMMGPSARKLLSVVPATDDSIRFWRAALLCHIANPSGSLEKVCNLYIEFIISMVTIHHRKTISHS